MPVTAKLVIAISLGAKLHLVGVEPFRAEPITLRMVCLSQCPASGVKSDGWRGGSVRQGALFQEFGGAVNEWRRR